MNYFILASGQSRVKIGTMRVRSKPGTFQLMNVQATAIYHTR
jgi:hypothetical protein